MPPAEPLSLSRIIYDADSPAGVCIRGSEASLSLDDLRHGTTLGRFAEELSGCSVLIATRDQVTAAGAMIELDGIARRLILCPADLPYAHFEYVARCGEVKVIVTDRPEQEMQAFDGLGIITISNQAHPLHRKPAAEAETEWVLLTSGTTGQPKLVAHTLATLAGSIPRERRGDPSMVWSTFYDIRRYGGLQIFLRAMLGGISLVLSGPRETTAQFLARAAGHRVSHISGTPSHWRRALMSPAAQLLRPAYVRLSGEIADQSILNQLRSVYPEARISHAFASTEAGVVFDIRDGLMGLPSNVIANTPEVEMKVVDGSLHVRSARTALRYLNEGVAPFKDAEGFVDTGDMLELRDQRYYFVGRRDGVINVGGKKVHPEEVEAVINRHPQVRMSLVHTRRNSLTGSLVVADVVLHTGNSDQRALQLAILELCRSSLTPHKVPAMLNFVSALPVAETGKLVRRYA